MARHTIARMPRMNVPRGARGRNDTPTPTTEHRPYQASCGHWATTPEHFDFYAYQATSRCQSRLMRKLAPMARAHVRPRESVFTTRGYK